MSDEDWLLTENEFKGVKPKDFIAESDVQDYYEKKALKFYKHNKINRNVIEQKKVFSKIEFLGNKKWAHKLHRMFNNVMVISDV